MQSAFFVLRTQYISAAAFCQVFFAFLHKGKPEEGESKLVLDNPPSFAYNKGRVPKTAGGFPINPAEDGYRKIAIPSLCRCVQRRFPFERTINLWR
ncbi:MAG: hypothetical protein HFG00_12110 [Oscillibacter sp.]|nr:hypothetical protein [Oscillibacter sp.]